LKESELLDSVGKDPTDFSSIFRLYHKPIFGYILRRTGDFDDTADLTADTFLKVYTHLNRFQYRGISIKVWIYRIATNEVNQFYRRSKRHASMFDRLDLNAKDLLKDQLRHDREEIEKEWARHEQFQDVLRALQTLPVKYQEVIALRYFEGKDNPEIAQILDMKEGTLKSLISRGLEKLRKKCNPA
jgi:RNA polymerase sigma-70 factor (ECF subfamily)